MPSNTISNFFKIFHTSINKTLLPRNPAIIITIIIDFTCCGSSKNTCFTIVIFLALIFTVLLLKLFFYINIHAEVIVLFLIFNF